MTLDDALANHAVNSALCRIDRLELTELQARIHQIRGTAPPATKAAP